MNGKDESVRLKKVPREKAFYFFTSIGNYIGESASSLDEFLEKIEKIDAKALDFHLYRGDFERWLSQVLYDEKLAEEVKKLREQGLAGENLRKQLCAVVSKHLQETHV
ncbi:hypothetical protein H5T51_05490 [Candidatus Bathyarchaeota archaeon]|nr:hypothetical protein [Candidatus Bathyarchaeota archaeon]